MPNLLLVTVNRNEAKAVLKTFSRVTKKIGVRNIIKGRTYHALGKIGGVSIFMVQSEMGSVPPGASLLTIREAIEALAPVAVFLVGVAFGVNAAKQKLGDILVSRKIRSYEPGRIIDGRLIPRGDLVTASTYLLDKFHSGDLSWKGAKVHFGVILSGEMLVDDLNFRSQLLEIEPEAIGGEMEGAGLYSAANDARVDWILIKGICDWADGNKSDESQPIAARNAANFVLHVLQQGGLRSNAKPKKPIIKKPPMGGDVVGRDKISTSIVNYYYYRSKDLQKGFLPPSVQFELVDNKTELAHALKGLRNKKGVLLWGFGGVGKTNLAAHAAYYASRWFKDGVIWLHVGQSDVYALCDGIARALNDDQLQRLPAHEKPDAVRRLLGGKRAFLVLDNVVSESTLREAPALCPSTIGLIATSRQNSASYGVRVELRSLEYRHARLLFCKRADLPSSKADDPNIAAICQAWKGYPLGIVLSAGRFLEHNLPLDRLVHHLRQIRLPDESLKYVSPELDQVHTLLENHFQPLTPKEIVLLNTIANNFGKSIRLAFLANIAQLSELEAETALGNLVRAALVTSSNGYYAVHDIIREALLVRMPAKENLRLKLQIAKNLEVFLESRLSFEGRWCVAPPKAWHEVEPEFDNCMGAIQWCLEHSHLKLAWNLYRLIDYPLGNLGYWDQEDQICKEVIAKAGYFDPGQTAWWKLNTLAFTHWERDETDEAEALTQEAWEIFSGLNDKIGIGEAVLMKANILVYKLKHDAKKNLARYKEMLAQTQFLFEQAIATFESQKDLRNLARAEGDFADYWYYSCDRPEIALTHCQRSIGIYSQLDEEEGLTLSQPPLCDIYISLGDLVKAEAMLEPMRLAARKLGRPDFEPQVDWSEADLREHQGDKLIRKKNKRKALAFYRKSLKAATRCKEAFVRIRMPFEARELLMQERRLKSKIKKLSH